MLCVLSPVFTIGMTYCAVANKFFKRKDFQLLTFFLSKQRMRIFAFEAYT